MINDLASLTLYLISKIGKKIKVTRPGYEKSKLLGSLDNWEPGQLSRIIYFRRCFRKRKDNKVL